MVRTRPLTATFQLERARKLNPALVHFLALSVVIAVALTVRLAYINALGYNSDEAVYAGQGAAIAQVPVLTDIFPVFRAHPLLFQFTLALFFKFWPYDWVGRLVSVGLGIVTVLIVYAIGNRLYGRRAGFLASLFMALMPYHVIVTRQVLLDGPMVLCTSIALFMLVRFAETERPMWLYVAGAAMGLTFLAKETGILLVGSIYAFLALSPEIRVRIRDVVISIVVMAVVMLPFPLSIRLSGASSGTNNFIVWQLFRRPNHTWDFYLTVVPPAMGILVILTALVGLWWLRRSNSWREKMLVTWIVVPIMFFQLWPTKGFQYLLPIAIPMALLAARTLAHLSQESVRIRGRKIPPFTGALAAVVICISLFVPTWNLIQPTQSDSFLAGTGGIPGGREMGLWISQNVPDNALFMTIGPSMANIVKWYGHHDALGLSVSPNPLHRNPSYDPVLNPDFQLRTGALQYIVWDSFSAGRSSFFSDKLMYYVKRYHGRVVNTQSVTVTTPDGQTVEKPVIIVYEVHP